MLGQLRQMCRTSMYGIYYNMWLSENIFEYNLENILLLNWFPWKLFKGYIFHTPNHFILTSLSIFFQWHILHQRGEQMFWIYPTKCMDSTKPSYPHAFLAHKVGIDHPTGITSSSRKCLWKKAHFQPSSTRTSVSRGRMCALCIKKHTRTKVSGQLFPESYFSPNLSKWH